MTDPIIDALKNAAVGGNDTPPDPTPEPKTQEPAKEPGNKGPDPKDVQIGQMMNTVNQLVGKVDALTQVQTNTRQDDDDDDDGDGEITAEKVREIARKEAALVKKETKEELTDEGKKNYWATETDKQFACHNFLDTTSRFYREVNAEYHKLSATEKEANPRAIFDAAQRIEGRGLREGWLSMTNFEKAKDNFNNHHGRGEGPTPGDRKAKEKEATEAQNFFGSKFGMDKERVAKVFNKGGSQ